MGNDLFAQLEKLELIVFFAGFSILYLLISLLVEFSSGVFKRYVAGFLNQLPISYALSGTLFLGWILKNWYEECQFGADPMSFHLSAMRMLGLLSLLFWIPFFNRLGILALLHSLLFFAMIFRDFYFYYHGELHREVMINDRNILSTSLILHISLLFIVILIKIIFKRLYLFFRGN